MTCMDSHKSRSLSDSALTNRQCAACSQELTRYASQPSSASLTWLVAQRSKYHTGCIASAQDRLSRNRQNRTRTMDTRNIKLTCIECHRTNAVPYGRGHRICDICSQRELKRERRLRTQRRIQMLGSFLLIVVAVWTSCMMASDWNTPNSPDHRAHQAMQSRD